MTIKPKAYVYIRWSSLRQEAGDSLRRQQEGIEEFTRRTGIDVSETFTDAGMSAFSGKNLKIGALKELTDKVDSGLIRPGSFIVVESIDRLTRQNVWKSISMLEKILTAGIKIYTTSDHMIYHNDAKADPRNSFGNFMYLSMIAQRSHEESVLKRERAEAVWVNKRKNAVENMKKGKLLTKRLPAWLSFEDGKFVIDHDMVYDIKKLLELLKHNGLDSSIRILEKKYKRSKHQFYGAYLSELLKDKRLYGILEPNKIFYTDEGKSYVKKIGEIEGYYPKVISEAELKEVHEIVSARDFDNNRGNWSPNKVNVFRSLIKCGHCGKPMTFKTSKKASTQIKEGWKEKYFYLECTNMRVRRCEAKKINSDRFETYFVKFFNLFNLDDIFNESITDKILSLNNELERVNEEFFATERKQEKISKTFSDFIEKGMEIPDSFMETASIVDNDLKKIKKERNELKQTLKLEESVASERFTSEELEEALLDEEKRRKLNSYLKIQKTRFHTYQDGKNIYVVADNLERSVFSQESELNDIYVEQQLDYWLSHIGYINLEEQGFTDEDIADIREESKKRYYKALKSCPYIVFSFDKTLRKVSVKEEEIAIGQYFIGDFLDIYNKERGSKELNEIYDILEECSIWNICEQLIEERAVIYD